MKISKLFRATLALILAIVGLLGGTAGAAVQQANDFSAGAALSNQTFFDPNISASDLINFNAPTFKQQVNGGTTSTGGAGGGTFDKLNDGVASSKLADGVNNLSGDTYFSSTDLNSSPTTTFFLNTTANPAGFSLSTIRTINGWADAQTFSNQRYTVSVRTVNATAFVPLRTVDYAPFTANSGTNPQNASMVTLTDSAGVLAANVDAVRFTYSTSSVTSSSGQVVREIDVLGQPTAGPVPPAQPAVPTIFPLGDSITYGDGSPVIPGGYRTKLYTNLKNAGRNFNFVGSQTGNASATLIANGQVNNEGHNGYRTGQMTANLTSVDGTGGNNGGHWLDGTGGREAIDPTFILLHAGTNNILQLGAGTDITSAKSELDTLVNELTSKRPNAFLLLSNIIPINDSRNANVLSYNAYIAGELLTKYKGLGRNIIFVDQYKNFVDANGNIIAARLPDKIHPDQLGYDLMGDTWFAAIQSVPEPTAVAGMACLAALSLLRRRRTRGGPLDSPARMGV